MKKLLLLTLGIAAVATTFTIQSCDKLKALVPAQDFTFGATADITISPTSDTTSQATIGQTTVSYNIDSLINKKSDGALGIGDIQSVNITSITFTLTDGDISNNFGNFEFVGASFNSNANNGDYDPYTIAFVENNPDVYSTTISPPVVDATQDVKKYFTSNMIFSYILSGKLRHPTTTTLHCHVDISYAIVIKGGS